MPFCCIPQFAMVTASRWISRPQLPSHARGVFCRSITAPSPQKVTLTSAKRLQARAFNADLFATNFLRLLFRRLPSLLVLPCSLGLRRSKLHGLASLNGNPFNPSACLVFALDYLPCKCKKEPELSGSSCTNILTPPFPSAYPASALKSGTPAPGTRRASPRSRFGSCP